jgi:serpin B
VQVPTMHQNSLLHYAEDERFQFLEIPYIDDRFSMYLLLPKKNIPVTKLVDGISAKQIIDLKMGAFPHKVDVLLPKFRVKTGCPLREPLSRMGVNDAFDKRKADFDRMIVKISKAYRVYISSIRQDAWIGVDEKGTKAASATTTTHFTFGCSAVSPPKPARFHADHPFLFFVVHNPSRSILFSGWVSEPGK